MRSPVPLPGPTVRRRQGADALKLFDLAVLALVAAVFSIGWRRGFARVLLPVAGAVAGIVVAALVAPPLIIRFTSPSDVVVRGILLTVAFGLIPVVGAGVASLLSPARGPAARSDADAGAPGGRVGVIGGRAAGGITAIAVLSLIVWILAPVSGRQEAYVSWSSGSATARVIDALPAPPVDLDELIAEGVLPPRLADLLGRPDRAPAPTEPAPLSAESLQRLRAASVQLFVYSCDRPATGSGFAIADGLVATNAHVVQGSTDPVDIVTTDGRQVTGTVVLYDEARDLALVAADDLGLVPLPLAGEEAGAGDLVTTAGHPLSDRELHVAPARVESIGFVVFTTDEVGSTTTRRLYELTSASVERGSSGGAVVNADGEVIGVVFAGRSEDDLAFATAVMEIRAVLDGHDTTAVATGTC